MFVMTVYRLSPLAFAMELGFYLDNKRLYCNQCWPMDCNCRLSFTGCKCSPIEVCDECLLLEGPWGEEE